MPDDQNQTQAPPTIQPPPSTTPPAPASPDNDARMWNMTCHLSALSGYIMIPFGNIIGPLIIWQIKKNEIPSIEIHAKAAMNFQITVLIALIVGIAVTALLLLLCVGWLFVPVLFLIGLAGVVFPVIAGIKANNGEDYKYPWSLELVK